MTELPQWAVERAEKAITEAKEGMWVHDDEIEHGSAAVRIIARALAEAALPKWQPIENAPMPEVGAPGYGARVLLAVDCGDGTVKGVRVGWWDGSGWVIDASYAKDLGYRVTHWMPLPAAPEVGVMLDDSDQTLLTRLRLRRMEIKERIQFCRRFGHFHAEDDLGDKLKDVEKQIRDREARL